MWGSAKVALVAAVIAALCMPASAGAAYPGSNGKLAFVRDNQIWTMNADGTGEAQLTSGSTSATDPEWSPDGQRILYTRGTPCGDGCLQREIRVMNSDGSGDAHVYGPGTYGAFSPTWAPDGRRAAFVRPNYLAPPCCWFVHEIVITDLGESNFQNWGFGVVDPQQLDVPEWSPRGDEMAFGLDAPGYSAKSAQIQRFRSAARSLSTSDPDENSWAPSWAPNADKLAFLSDLGSFSVNDVWTANEDGTGRVDLTNTDVQEFGAEWSPDGNKIVYSGEDPACVSGCNADLWVMNPDGTGRARLTTTSTSETSPDWQPVIGPPPPGYPRPRGATPFHVSLVPAYSPCAAPNRTHGSPLAFGSCAPPHQASSNVTVGTPDANGAPAKMVGSLEIDAIADDTATPGDEADVKLALKVTDVRCYAGDTRSACHSDNAEGGRDYRGGLRTRMSLRLTDRYNLPAPGGNLPGTMSDTPVEFNLYGCSYTDSDPTVGSTCALTTTTGATLGIEGGRRAIMELGQVEVLDGGQFGDVSEGAPSSGMSAFLRQGLFVP